MDYILYCHITKNTGTWLAEDLHIQHGAAGRTGIRTLIRWGNATGIGYIPRCVINKQAALEKAINKELATQLFQENHLSVPLLTETVPCVGRSAYHTQGQNFWLCWERRQIQTAKREGAEYFIKYIPVKQEWRVHVINREVAFVQNKFEPDRVSTSFMGIQGFRDEWHKKFIDPSHAGEAVCTLAVRAVNTLGLDFGGVDIIVSLENGRPYILEINTGPALPTTETRRPYVEYFRSILEA